jgi:hypothetical protein
VAVARQVEAAALGPEGAFCKHRKMDFSGGEINQLKTPSPDNSAQGIGLAVAVQT